MQQLKKCGQNEGVASKREKTMINEAHKRRRESGKRVVFVSSIMLLEAAARNDIDEGKLDKIMTLMYRIFRNTCVRKYLFWPQLQYS